MGLFFTMSLYHETYALQIYGYISIAYRHVTGSRVLRVPHVHYLLTSSALAASFFMEHYLRLCLYCMILIYS